MQEDRVHESNILKYLPGNDTSVKLTELLARATTFASVYRDLVPGEKHGISNEKSDRAQLHDDATRHSAGIDTAVNVITALLTRDN